MKTLEYQKISYKESILLFTHKDLHIDLGDKKIIVSDYDKKKHRACYFPALEKLSLDELAYKYGVANLSMRSLTKLFRIKQKEHKEHINMRYDFQISYIIDRGFTQKEIEKDLLHYIELTNEKETLKAFSEECIDFINGGCKESE